MPRRAKPLTDRQIRQAKTPGVLIDGGGLRLRVEARKDVDGRTIVTKRWIARLTVKGLGVREGGLGGYPAVALAQAREITAAMRAQAKAGVDPFEARAAAIKAEADARAEAAAKAVTFKECALAYIEAHKRSWKNSKHRQQWENTLASTYDTLGALPVCDVDTAAVLGVLKPIWTKTPETASRLRGRIETVLDAATAQGLRSGRNPAQWRNHLDKLLPARGKIAPIKHHTALDWREAPAFWARLSEREGMGAKALAFLILTAARSNEVRGMLRSEVDLQTRTWSIPAERMKARRSHSVPLSNAAVEIVRERLAAVPHAPDALVFPGARDGRPMSDMTLTAVLRRMRRGELTAHGMRSTFRDWAGEATSYPRELAEHALAHVIGDRAEQAYRRGDALERRRSLMRDWASYLAKPAGGAVVDLGAVRTSNAGAG